MSVPVLVCGCGQRVKAPGASPGRVGRCPKCGAVLKMPETEAPPVTRTVSEEEFAAPGYYVEVVSRSPSVEPKRRRRGLPTDPPAPARQSQKKDGTSRRAGGVPASAQPGGAGSSVLYPLRAAEGLLVVTILSVVFWVLTLLVPEYCLSLMSDAEMLDARPMGRLVSLISALPAVMLFLPALFYNLQYLGRVLVSSALGEDVPPRPPDRNFDGFLNGLAPWLIWLFGGVSVGYLPLVGYWLSCGEASSPNWLIMLGLALFGLSYAVMALLMTFLHDDSFAAKPPAVIATIARLGFSFGGVCLAVVAAFGLVAAAFAGALVLRGHAYWIYLAAGLPCWFLAHWMAIVVMRVLGLYYYRRRKRLRWHRERPRWGVNWGI